MKNSITTEDGLVFNSCQALFVFPNAGGDVSIKQYSEVIGDDVVIYIPLHYIERTINALRQAKRDAEDLKDA